MHITSRYSLFFKIILSLGLLFTQTTNSHDFVLNTSLASNAGMRATIGCGGGAALGSSFGPVGTITGVIIGGLIGFLVNKCTRKIDHKYDGLWFNDSIVQANKVSTKTVEDIVGECEPFGHKRSLKQYIKEGNYQDAVKDFESLDLSDIKDLPNGKQGKMGMLPDGRRVNVRIESSAKVPTLEIYNPVDESQIKIRYV